MKSFLHILFATGALVAAGGNIATAAESGKLSRAEYERLSDIFQNGKNGDLKKWIDAGLNVNAAYQCHRPLNMAIRQLAFTYGSLSLGNTTPSASFEQVKMLLDAGFDINLAANVGCQLEKSPLDEALSLPMTLKGLQLNTVNTIDNVFRENIAKCERKKYKGVECSDVSEENRALMKQKMNEIYEEQQKKMALDVLKMVEFLVANGANLHQTDRNGQTPLHRAVILQRQSSSLDAIELLIKNGANINARDNKGNTPLFFAHANPELQQYLIQAGADTTIRNNDGLLYNEVTGRLVIKSLEEGVYHKKSASEYE